MPLSNVAGLWYNAPVSFKRFYMAHCIVPEAEAVLDKTYPVLDKGFVRLVDYYGGDQRIVQSARVSYGTGTKSVSQDAALIDYLLRHQHTSPFEQVVMTFHLKMPIFVARQWVRHRTGRMNEVSGRYSIMKDEFYVPAAENIALQSPDNKQGRAAEPLPAEKAEKVRNNFEEGQERAYAAYTGLVEDGLAREIARINLPLSLYTEFYWQMDLHNLFHFLKLRLDAHAQLEIREYAKVLLLLAGKVAPVATASFSNYMEQGVTFSGEEMEALRQILRNGRNPLEGKKLERFNAKVESGTQL
jgi:thymidylate synthase (FAD)